jgi:hypothetical protein
MIKKNLILIISFHTCLGISTYCCRSTIVPRPIIEDNTYTLLPYNLPESQTWALNITPFYIKSTQKNKVGSYFLFGSRSMSIGDEDCNVAPEWFGLEAPVGESIDSTLMLNPNRSSSGILFFGGYNLTNSLFATITLPLVHISQKLNMCEYRTGSYGFDSCIKTFSDALNQSSWCHGKFCSSYKSKTGVEDIAINLGYKIKQKETALWDIFLKGIIPTGETSYNRYVFEPFVGSKHWALGLGTTTNIKKIGAHASFNWFVIVDYLYRFKAHEYRSFDLCNNGCWSRYLLLVHQDDTTTPLDGINILTQQVDVTPRSRAEFTTGIRIETDICAFTLGYDLWYRASEKIRCCKNLSAYGIFNTHETSEDGTTASTATINVPPCSTAEDSSFVALGNINLDSGTQPSSVNNKIFGGFTRTFVDDESKKIKVEIWGSYEHAHKNSAFSQWSIWGTVGFEF